MEMNLVTWIVIFCAALAVLVKSSDWLISAAERAGRTLHMPPFLIGVVLVGFGTSLPELVSSILAVTAGSSEIVIGNVLGSNITNILLILGISSLAAGSYRVRQNLIKFDLPVMAGSAFLLALMVDDANFTLGEALICLMALLVYLVVMLRSGSAPGAGSEEDRATALTWLTLLVTPVLIFVGAKYTIDAVIAISGTLNIGTDVIALSAVALGTSLPEIVVSLNAARRGQPELIVGNIIGSNIFNTLAVMGIPGLLGTLHIPQSVLDFSLLVFIASTVLGVIITVDRRITRGEGAFLLTFYCYFLARLFEWV